MLAHLAAGVVGLVLLATGTIKALDPRPFFVQLSLYGVPAGRAQRALAVGIAGLETGLGAALLVGAWPEGTVPAAIALLAGFSAVTLWGWTSGRVEACGCYGGLLELSPRQSLLANAGYVALLAAAWMAGEGETATAEWKAAIAGGGALWGLVIGGWGLGHPVVRLRPGRRWRARWLGREIGAGERFVVFLSADCPHCKQWIPLLNVMDAQAELPGVLGVLSDEVEAFRKRHLVRFPVARMPRLLYRTLVSAFPTAVLVRDGRIERVWEGEIPPEYLDRIRTFLQAVAPKKPAGKSRFTG